MSDDTAVWAASLTAADCVTLIHRCLDARDMEGVAAALRLLAVKDPHEAQVVLDTINVGMRLASDIGRSLPDSGRAETPPESDQNGSEATP